VGGGRVIIQGKFVRCFKERRVADSTPKRFSVQSRRILLLSANGEGDVSLPFYQLMLSSPGWEVGDETSGQASHRLVEGTF